MLLFVMGVFGGDTDADADIGIDADVDVDIDTGDLGGPGAISLKLILFFLRNTKSKGAGNAKPTDGVYA